MIFCSGYQSLVVKENVCEGGQYWTINLNDIRDDEALTNIVLCDVKFNPSTAEAQRNDLLPMLTAQVKDGKGKRNHIPQIL